MWGEGLSKFPNVPMVPKLCVSLRKTLQGVRGYEGR